MNIHEAVRASRRDAKAEPEEDCEEDGASAQASAFTKTANKSGDPKDHKVAAAAHGFAATMHERAGNPDEQKHHMTMQEGHQSSRYAANPFKVAEK